jgi:hypothetical protein
MAQNDCAKCAKPSTSLHYEDGSWICRHCRASPDSSFPYFKEMGAANHMDPKGSTAHYKDIEDRRWHPEEKRLFYYSKEMPGRTYFLPKG